MKMHEMKRTSWARRGTLTLSMALGLIGFSFGSEARDPRPNIVLIVSDDQGYADMSCHEHPEEVHTPHIDRLAREGVLLTNGYASAWVCAPTRAGLLTGRYQQRFGFYTAGDSRIGLPLSEMTIADLLSRKGYATGIFGKWHLGIKSQYHPLQRGFKEFYGFLGHGAHDYFNLKRTEPYNSIYRDEKIIDDTGYLTDNLAREAVSFIERNRNKPFFLYLPFNAVHWPLQAPQEDIQLFDTGDKNRDIYLAMLRRMDLAVGEVLRALEKTGVDDNTLLIFFSDNGGAKKNHADNSPLRGFKQSVYEGGIRVPFMVRWPSQLPKNKVCNEPVICLDILPTVCAAAGVDLPRDHIFDGKNLIPLLRDDSRKSPHEALFWDGGSAQWAVRKDRWKLLSNRERRLELYDLELDKSETLNLADQHPDIVERLQETYKKWKKKMAPPMVRPGTKRRDGDSKKWEKDGF